MTNRSEGTTDIRWFETLGSVDVELVGRQNASLGEIGVAGIVLSVEIVRCSLGGGR